jgi:hypothetical protein
MVIKKHTGESIQALNCVSSAWQPAIVAPDDAQQATKVSHALCHYIRGKENRTEHGGHDCQTWIRFRLVRATDFESWEWR